MEKCVIFCCRACGTSFTDASQPPTSCLICNDDRQFVPPSGQAWIALDALAATHSNSWRQCEPGLFTIRTTPQFAIGQRAILLQTQTGNILWDCVSLLDDATRAMIQGLGGLAAIAISHPHFYTTMQDWADEFSAPVYLHADDKYWVQRSSEWLRFWDGDTLQLNDQATLVRAGGHFPGSAVLRWTGAQDGKPVLLAGDTVQVTPDARHVSFMWSYPNQIPLSTEEIERLSARLAPWSYERIYGGFPHQNVMGEGDSIVARSAERYIRRLNSAAV